MEYAIWLVKIYFNFFEINQLSVMNSFYKKKYYSTWTYPGTKICHMIDFVIMKTSQRNCFMDVQVRRGASCWTNIIAQLGV